MVHTGKSVKGDDGDDDGGESSQFFFFKVIIIKLFTEKACQIA